MELRRGYRVPHLGVGYGIKTTFTKDDFGNVASATKENENSTSFQYKYGQVRESSTPGVVVTRDINPDGTVAWESIAGRTTNYSYDNLSRVTPPRRTQLPKRTSVARQGIRAPWIRVLPDSD